MRKETVAKTNVSQPTTPKRILRLPETIKKTGLSRSTIRRLELAKLFPQRVRVGLRGCGHHEHEIDQFIAESERVTLSGQEAA